MANNWRNIGDHGIIAADFRVFVSYNKGSDYLWAEAADLGFSLQLENGVLSWKMLPIFENLVPGGFDAIQSIAIVLPSTRLPSGSTMRLAIANEAEWMQDSLGSSDYDGKMPNCAYGWLTLERIEDGYDYEWSGDLAGALTGGDYALPYHYYTTNYGSPSGLQLRQTEPDPTISYGIYLLPQVTSGSGDFSQHVNQTFAVRFEIAGLSDSANVSLDVQPADKQLRLRQMRKLLPRKLQAVDAWRDYADAIDLVVSHRILDPAMGIPGIRDPRVAEEDLLPQLSELLGFPLRADYYTDAQKRFIVESLYQYYSHGGTPSFESFLALLSKYQVKLNVLWTRDYHEFQRSPGGVSIYESPELGEWYLTPHYEIYLDGEDSYTVTTSTMSGALGTPYSRLGRLALGAHLGAVITYRSLIDEGLVETMFYDLAPVHLVLERIVRGYVAHAELTVAADALPSVYTGRAYPDLTPRAAVVDRGAEPGDGLIYVQGYLSNIRNEPIQVQYRTVPGTVSSPSSYLEAAGAVTVPAGTVAFRIPVTILDTAQLGYFRVYIDPSLTDPVEYTIWKQYATVTIDGDVIPPPNPDAYVVWDGAAHYCYSEATSTPGSPDPLRNGSFDDGNDNWTVDPRWQVMLSGGYDGGPYMRRLGGSVGVSILASEAHRVAPGTAVELRGRIRLSSTATNMGARIHVFFYDVNGTRIETALNPTVFQGVANMWTEYVATGLAPPNAWWARAAIDSTMNGSSATADFDQLSWDLPLMVSDYNDIGVGLRLLPTGEVQWLARRIADAGVPSAVPGGRWYAAGHAVNAAAYEARFTEETAEGVYAEPTAWTVLGTAVEYYRTTPMQTPNSGARWLVGTLEIRNRNSGVVVQTTQIRAVNSRVPGADFCAAWPDAPPDFTVPTVGLSVTLTPTSAALPANGTATRSFTVAIVGGTGEYSVSAAITEQPSRGTLSLVSATETALVVEAAMVTATAAGTAGTVRYTVTSGSETVDVDVSLPDSAWQPYNPPGGGGCPTLDMYVVGRHGPMQAKYVEVGDSLLLADPVTGEEAWGTVTVAETVIEDCVRVDLANGAWLTCSRSAPLGTADGPVLAPESSGARIRSKLLEQGAYSEVTAVTDAGSRLVRHITVGDRYYWVGAEPGQYVLHHNVKNNDLFETGGNPDLTP